MAGCRSLILRLFVLLYVLKSIECLYENQIGKVDWKRSFVGKTVLAQYDESSQNSRRYLVVSEAGVLASINTRTGKIEWRQVFTDGLDAMVHDSSKLVTYHRETGLLRSWNTASGYLIWESLLKLSAASCPGTDLRVSQYCKKGALLQLTTSNTLVVMDGVQQVVLSVQMSSGKTAWRQSLPPGHTYYSLSVDESVFAVGVHTREVFVQELRMEDGAPVSNRTVPTEFLINDKQCTMSGVFFMCIDHESGALVYFNVKTDRTFTETSLKSLNIGANPGELSLRSLWQPALKENLITIATTATPFHTWVLIIKDSQVLKLETFEKNVFLTQVQSTLVSVSLSDNVLTMSLSSIEEDGTKKLQSSNVQWPETEGPPEQCLAHVYQRSDGSHGYRLIVFTEDDTVLQIKHPGEMGWIRDEAPARITRYMVWDLLQLDAPPQSSDEITGFSQFLHRLQYQAVEVQEFVQSLNYNSFVNMFTSKRAKVFSREEFNVRKMLLLATKSGKLFGISTDDGEFIWKRWIPNIGVYSTGTHLLFKLRGLTHPPLEPLAALFAPGKAGCDGTVVVHLNPLTGRDTVPPSCEPFHVLQAVSLPITDRQHRSLLLLALEDGSYRLFPHNQESMGLFSSFGQEVYVYSVSKEEGVVEGFQVKLDQTKSSIEWRSVWVVNFTAASQKIVSVATKSDSEVVNAQAKVSGEHAVLFKYLNPHVIAIATETEGREKCQFEMCILTDKQHSQCKHLYPILVSVHVYKRTSVTP
jgi:outer membrane protein assembly factor BamB